MKLKKALIIAMAVIVLTILMMCQTTSYAATANPPMYLNRLPLRTLGGENMGYATGVPSSNGTTGDAAVIWNIVKYSTATSNDPTEANIYCVKAGVGFVSDDHIVGDSTQHPAYDVFYNMKTEREAIKAQNDILKGLVEGTTIPLDDGTTVSRYDALLALLDIIYVHGETTPEEKAELLRNAGINPETHKITVNDITATQQVAIWYFTNYGEENGKYDKTDDDTWLLYTTDGKNYASLADYNLAEYEGIQREQQATLLLKYLINTAKKNAKNYSATNSNGVPATVNTTKLNSQKDADNANNIIVGPINITETQGNTTPYTISFEVKNNGTNLNRGTDYKLLNANKQEISATKKVEDLVGEDFYIVLSSDKATNLTVNMAVNYSTTTLTLWASNTNNQEQPVVIPKKENESIPVVLPLVIEEEKPFDLSLRKYITAVDGVSLTGESSRVPVIIEDTIESATTTATYKHKKDPVIVKTGSKVTYNLTIYNEGEKIGRATEVVDQLPTGLKFSKVVSGNFELGSYDQTTNKLTLVRKNDNTENLDAYVKGALDSETIQIECEVTATPDVQNTKILTNVAWISKAYDAVDNITITNQEGADRDSEPATEPKINNQTPVNKDNMENYTGNTSNKKEDLADEDYYYKGQQDDDDFEKLILMPESFDLKLIKRITAVNNQNVPERIESVDVSKLNTLDANGKLITTAIYKMTKDPVGVKKGDLVTYTFRIYNEGTIDGYASEITEDIPEGLEYLWDEGISYNADGTINWDEVEKEFTAEEKAAIEFNLNNGWSYAGDTTLKTIKTDYLSRENETSIGDGSNLIKAFGDNDGTKTEADLSYKEISVILKVVSNEVTGTIIRNEAGISEDTNANGEPINDRDSSTEDWKKEDSDKYYDDDEKWPVYKEDDEDYDNIILKSFDLALRKFIMAVSKDTTIEEKDYLKNENGAYKRAPVVDTSKLNTIDENGNLITTAIYNHTKEPVAVRKNDIVVYMLRVYNEGEISGYASEIKDHLPAQLEFVDGEFNKKYGWEKSEDGRTVTTKYLANTLINKAETDANGKIVLTYKEVPIMCKVKDTAKTGEKITNIADITEYLDENKQSIADRDSQEDNVQLPADENLPSYKDNENGAYVPGQQDDDDFEKVIIKKFDLALRKFITKIEDEEIDSRIPQVKYENGKISYEHDKTPLQVVTGDTVIYTIRIFNEGEIAGYASEITDDIPDGLEFLPEHKLNKNMRWKMIDEKGNETEDIKKAVKITTDYLSKEQDEDNLLNEFNPKAAISDTNPDYKDVQVAFKVTEPNSSDRIIINSAQISDDTDENGNPVEDEDSIPGKWNEGEDDQDKEYIKLLEFDLALRKWVTQAIVIENGKQTVTQTGHKPYDDPEQVVKVELHRKKLDKLTVKFRYSIRIINEGDIAGYATEITDYVPEGLKFIAEDNKGWKDEGNNVISTRLLENTLLQPGEYADVQVVLTWINNKDNMGLKVNTAEISEDDNEFNVPDRDSTPDNKKRGEDDIDDAPVMLAITTGQVRIYFTLGFIILITIAGGVMLIKKFVL